MKRSQITRAFATECNDIISTEFSKCADALRTQLAELPRCWKKWWKLSSQLLDKTAPRTSTPSLRTPEGQWLHDPAQKAQLFADKFAMKFVLPNEIGEIDACEPSVKMHDWVPIRQRWSAQTLKRLRIDQATGPDHLPARILQS